MSDRVQGDALARGEAGARALHGAPGLPRLSGLPAASGDAGREDRGALHLRCQIGSKETLSPEGRQELEHFMALRDCPACQGSRLRPETLAVKIAGRSISDVVRFSIKSARQFFDTLTLSERDAQIA